MDESHEYITMCGKAEEIQALRCYEYPNSFAGLFRNGDDVYYQPKCWREDRESVIWLPRQDQLQGMLTYSKPISLVDNLNYFCCPMDRLGTMPHKRAMVEAQKQEDYIASFTSMEQLWLSFIMNALYNKRWLADKLEWVNECQ